MDLDLKIDPLVRSVSQLSSASLRNHRSRLTKAPKLASQVSSCSSSIAPSDKSLTSFPTFLPDPPRARRIDPAANSPAANPPVAASPPDHARFPLSTSSLPALPASRPPPRPNALAGLIIPRPSGLDSDTPADPRPALFDDSLDAGRTLPGALHTADGSHIERLIARHGAVGLVRQVAEDLARRDVQIAALRRAAAQRERALRKIILDCGLSSLDLETRIRVLDPDPKANGDAAHADSRSLSDMMSDAMQDYSLDMVHYPLHSDSATTFKPNPEPRPGLDGEPSKGWRDFLWGGPLVKKSRSDGKTQPSRAGSVHEDCAEASAALPGSPSTLDHGPPRSLSMTSSSRASSTASAPLSSRKVSLANLAMRLVVGGATTFREGGAPRGRSGSSPHVSQSGRAMSPSSAKTVPTTSLSASTHPTSGPRSLAIAHRKTAVILSATASNWKRGTDRWEPSATKPAPPLPSRLESFGPVEMDTILPPEMQPPTLLHLYNHDQIGRSSDREYLTDRFGFIYDQRRKRRQRQAAQTARNLNLGNLTEMLTNGRSTLPTSPNHGDSPTSPGSPEPNEFTHKSPHGDLHRAHHHGVSEERLENHHSALQADLTSHPVQEHEAVQQSVDSVKERAVHQPRRWQDYLKIATFPTELLSHTPSIVPALETSSLARPSPILNLSTDQRRLFWSPVRTPSAAVVDGTEASFAIDSDCDSPGPDGPDDPCPAAMTATVGKEDAEPVRLLLQQLNDVHDTLQLDRTVRWNEFLRKVRAERRREGEAAAAAAAAAAEARYEQPAMMLPEATLTDGEMIGIAGLGNKGKVGRAKWNEFKSLVLGGIPVAYRSKVWTECSGATSLRIPGSYDDLVAYPDSQDDPAVAAQIRMDIHRTLTDNIFFRASGPGVAKLEQVLLAYSRRNPYVGYCQGMNLIVANLLLITPSAQDAFWILASIVENILPAGYYDQSLLTSRADQRVLRHYVATVLPRLSQHLDRLGIQLEALTFQWFLSVFTDCLSAEALFRVWDVVLCTGDGATFLFHVALALLKLNEGPLLQCATPAEAYTYINHQMTNHAISIDGLIHACEGLRRVVNRDDVAAHRASAIADETEAATQRLNGLAARPAPESPPLLT